MCVKFISVFVCVCVFMRAVWCTKKNTKKKNCTGNTKTSSSNERRLQGACMRVLCLGVQRISVTQIVVYSLQITVYAHTLCCIPMLWARRSIALLNDRVCDTTCHSSFVQPPITFWRLRKCACACTISDLPFIHWHRFLFLVYSSHTWYMCEHNSRIMPHYRCFAHHWIQRKERERNMNKSCIVHGFRGSRTVILWNRKRLSIKFDCEFRSRV